MQTSEGIITRGWANACLHSIFLIVMTTTVAIFYERGNPGDISLIAMSSWSLTPTPCHYSDHEETCISSFNNISPRNASECILNSNHQYYFYTSYGERGSASLCNLIGESPIFERKGKNLFSVLGIPFILLTTQIITTAFALMYVRHDSVDNLHISSSNMQKSIKKLTLLMLVTYAASFLLIQNMWKIPGNNLFLVEIFLLFVLFIFAFLPSSHFSEFARHQVMPLRAGEFALTIPLLTAAVLGVSGNTIITDITNAFFSVLFANIFLLLLEAQKNGGEQSYETTKIKRTILLNAWLCLISFIMYCAVTIERLSQHPHYSWTLASIIALLIYEILYVLTLTVYNVIDYQSSSLTHYLSFTTGDYQYHYFNLLNFILDFMSISAQIFISMSIMGGALSSFSMTKS